MKSEIMFDNLSRSAQELLSVQEDILTGKYGNPGDSFITTRALAESRQISIVTAHNVLTDLCDSGYLELRGKKYYLSHETLRKQHDTLSKIIGLIVPQIDNEYFSSLTDALITSAKNRSYSITLMVTSYYPEEERKVLELFSHFGVAGIINCVPTPKENEHLYMESKLPCVFLGRNSETFKRNSIQVNAFPISQKVARHLINEGYTQFMYIGTKNSLPLEKDIRFMAFQMELKQHGFTLPPQNILQISYKDDSDVCSLTELIKKQHEPVGVFCYHDLIAAKLYRACAAANKRIPEDVGIVGFDNLSIASSLIPPLSSIQYRIASMAEMTMDLIVAAINTGSKSYDNYYVDPNLIIRGSSCLSSGIR